MAQRKSTIRHNPLAAVAATAASDEIIRDDTTPVRAAGTAVEAEVVPEPTPIDATKALSDEIVQDATAPARPAEAAVAVAAEIVPEPIVIEGTLAPTDDIPAAPLNDTLAAEATPAPASPANEATTGRRDQGVRIVRSYMGWSSAAGLLPLPGLDISGVAAVQVKMLHSMARLYDVPFNKTLARQLVVALFGGGGAMIVALPMATVAKTLPVVGTMAGMLLSPAIAVASCYATGHAFLRHFEAGGTLETFDPGTVQAQAATP